MASYTVRKLASADLPVVRDAMYRKLKTIFKRSKKTWVQNVDLSSVLDFIFNHEHSYVLDETYLVVYDISEPWYSKGSLILSEMLVGKLGQKQSFDIVPHFLETQAREAGCKLVSAGTALALDDVALASLYRRSGFEPECLQLTKRI